MKFKQRPVTIVAIAAARGGRAICGAVVWRVERALGNSKGDLARRESLGVEIRTFGPQPNPGFEGITAPAVLKSAVVFQGHIYLAGPAGLSAYSINGSLE